MKEGYYMTMDINDMKDTFLANTHESAMMMLDFIRNDLKIDDSYIWNYISNTFNTR